MTGHSIVVVGASAGGLEALQALVAGLPSDFPAAVFVVWHISAESPGLLPQILAHHGKLPVRHAEDGAPIKLGTIYVAPPDRHLVLKDDRMRLTRGPKENGFRPAIDPLFRSAALAYGSQVIGVILSGALDDGTAGLAAIKSRGGLAVVQDPEEALNPMMPRSAFIHVSVDHKVSAQSMGPLLADLVDRVVEGEPPVSKTLEIETRIALEEIPMQAGVMELGKLSPYTCPECHGSLVQITADGILRFRCHTGHAFSVGSLLAEVGETIEETLWSAIRGIEEHVMLLQQVAQEMVSTGHTTEAQQLQHQAREAEQQAQLVRLVVLRRDQKLYTATSIAAESSAS